MALQSRLHKLRPEHIDISSIDSAAQGKFHLTGGLLFAIGPLDKIRVSSHEID